MLWLFLTYLTSMKEHEKFFLNTALTPLINEYDVLFYVSPEGVEIEDNGVRETDANYRMAIDREINQLSECIEVML